MQSLPALRVQIQISGGKENRGNARAGSRSKSPEPEPRVRVRQTHAGTHTAHDSASTTSKIVQTFNGLWNYLQIVYELLEILIQEIFGLIV